MSNLIKLLYYQEEYNLGDMLNLGICQKLFQLNVRTLHLSKYNYFDIVMIGSLLQHLICSEPSLRHRIKYYVNKKIKNPIHIWGSGFLNNALGYEILKRDLKIHALRGKKTRERLENIIGKKLDNVVLADPGILADKIVNKSFTKKYSIGIIPHYMELNYEIFSQMLQVFPNSVLINVQDPYEKNLEKIYQCNVILSSALHGLIIADGMHIPNLRMIVSDRIDSYKFDDYYSAYNIDTYASIDIRNKNIQDVLSLFLIENGRDGERCVNISSSLIENYIMKNHCVSFEDVDRLKDRLIASFPFGHA
ncbi:polysaccharide pyruvyl transferase family protein [Campylobacter coli]|nr:polysaccharide pyruvyl transferase family protein [Campylobacter coli]EAJ7403036.1 polysaccharide pyruvyl transferase family protein [Campylobacter coli]EED2625720.1 polysaccharide pyruvyl transferase family protein [Campylobacter coli]EGK8154370.1 polysaccharide pyruvyl transferase family protein [Campylobacter coli]HEA7231822.1 polysaccharide pyruvyl transferase family protein [Campylobacter coli]